jgi:Zn finger protein HypA/HybF involved in hydrogenase expression
MNKGTISLAVKSPKLAKQWHPSLNFPLLPEEVANADPRIVWWLGECGHEFPSRIASRSLKGKGCGVCSGKRVLKGFNDLESQLPDLALEFHPNKNNTLKVDEIFYQWGQKVWWLSPTCGHEWESTVVHRAKGSGCLVCTGKMILIGFNDLEFINPELARYWHPAKNGTLLPSQVFSGSDKTVWWICSLKHEWEQKIQVQSRYKGSGCPYCSNHKVLVGFNDLATTHSSIAVEWHPTKNPNLTPKEVTYGANDNVWWLASCGHEWEKSVKSRVLSTGCPWCSSTNKRVQAGFNDFATLRSEIAKEWHPTKNGSLKPSDVTLFRNRRAWWLCKNGHEFEQFISDRANGVGCNKCHAGQLSSNPEKEIQVVVAGFGLTIETSNRTILNGKEVDIYIPSKHVGIEYNGVYWHSDKRGKGPDYHYNKWLVAKQAGVDLIQVWEDDWLKHPDLVKSLLARKLGVLKKSNSMLHPIRLTGARVKSFFTVNHLQGFIRGTDYIGLESLKGVLIAAMVLNIKDGKVKIARYAAASNYDRGFTNLVGFIEETFSPDSVSVVDDHMASNFKLFAKAGFLADKDIKPSYLYSVRAERLSKSQLPPKSLEKLDSLPKVWDAGKTVWVKSL